MTEFGRLQGQVNDLVAQVDKLASVPISERFVATNDVFRVLNSEVIPKLEKFVNKANEKDPDKRIYGAGMVSKILALEEQVATFSKSLACLMEEVATLHEAALAAEKAAKLAAEEEQRRIEAARIEEEKEALRKKAEAERHAAELERQRLQLEAERKAAEAELQRKEHEKAAQEQERIRKEKEAELARMEAIRVAEEHKQHLEREKGRQDALKREEALRESQVKPSPVAATSDRFHGLGISFGQVNEVFDSDIFREVVKNAGDVIVVVDFMAPWCRPCVNFAPRYAEMAAAMPTVLFVKVDCDALPDIPPEFSIRAFPTFHVYFRGNKVGMMTGASEPNLRAEIQKAEVAADEILTAEAVAASLSESVPTPPVHAKVFVSDDWKSVEEDLLATTLIVAPAESVSGPLRSRFRQLSQVHSKGEYQTALTTLEKIVRNIVQNPSNKQYQVINPQNAVFTDKLGRLKGSSEILTLLGFELKPKSDGSGMQWECAVEVEKLTDALEVIAAAIREASTS